jgi:hypothetical protein
MDGGQVVLPAELLALAGVNLADASRDGTMLLALELYRENKISLRRASDAGRLLKKEVRPQMNADKHG